MIILFSVSCVRQANRDSSYPNSNVVLYISMHARASGGLLHLQRPASHLGRSFGRLQIGSLSGSKPIRWRE